MIFDESTQMHTRKIMLAHHVDKVSQISHFIINMAMHKQFKSPNFTMRQRNKNIHEETE